MFLWIDDIRYPPSPQAIWIKSVNDAKVAIKKYLYDLEYIDIDHDAGDYAFDGGDYIKVLDWLEEQNLSFPIHIHSMNPVGIMNMRAIIQKNNWKEI